MNTRTPGINDGPSTRQLVLTYVAYGLLLVLYGAATMMLLFTLRNNLVNLAFAFQFNPWVIRAIDRFGLFLLGLLWLMAFILIEGYFRKGVQKNDFWRRAGKTFLIVALSLCASQALNWLL